MFLTYLLVVSILASTALAQSEKSQSVESSAKQSLPIGPPLTFSPDVYQIGLQYPGLNYVPNKQFYPGVQTPVIYYGGGAIPGQQFLYSPGSPPGNFLIPQPGPGVMYPQTPVFQAGYPKPAHIPPIEKDAEEVPHLAGNHPPNRDGGQFFRSVQPQKLETFDEPVSATEQDDLAEADKVPNNYYPKKAFPNRPILKPGQQFFILNGNTLFSNIPIPEAQVPRQIYEPNFEHTNQEPLAYQHPYLFGRQEKSNIVLQPFEKQSGNYISLNNVADFRHNVPLSVVPYETQPQIPFTTLAVPVTAEDFRTGKAFDITPPIASYYSGPQYPFILSFDENQKQDDDTVTIEAKPAEEVKKAQQTSTVESEEPSLSQAKPSALALSGMGGVASAGPRGTALVGNQGVAVASPSATAIAGPAKDEPEKKTRPKKERH